MKVIKNKSFKNFIIIFSLITLCSFNFRVKKTEAFVSEAIAIGGGISIAPEVAVGLVGAGLVYGGYKLFDAYVDDVKGFIINKISSFGASKFFSIVNKNGQDYATINQDGLNFIQSQAESLKQSNSYEIKHSQKVVDNDKIGIAPFNYKGVTLYHYSLRPYTNGKVFASYKVSANSPAVIRFNLAFSNSDNKNYYLNLKAYSSDYYYRVKFHDSSQAIEIQYSSDCVTWHRETFYSDSGYSYKDVSLNGASDICVGISCDNPVYVPSSVALTGGIDGNASDLIADGSVVAISVDAPVDIDGQRVYSSSDLTTTVLDGVTTTVPDVDSGEVEGTISGTLSGILERVIQGINSIVESITGYGSKIISSIKSIPDSIASTIESIFTFDGTVTLDFSPLQIATQKFPFCIPWDLYQCVKIFNSDESSLKYEFKEVKYADTDIIIIPNFTVDFSTIPYIDTLRSILKFFMYICFVVFLINKIKELMN